MTKLPLHLLCFTSVFLCFFPSTTPTPLVNSKDQACIMCDSCDNPCNPPDLLPPPPPPPQPECPPPPVLPPSIELECPPPPAPTSTEIYYYSPPPPETPTSPETYYNSPPPPPPSDGESGCTGCYGGLPPPTSVVPYFPYSNFYPPSQDYHSSSSTLKVHFIASFSIIVLPLILG